jgi:predicted glycoside hydrolase/deacetylase ChbG (UPF0249 family)
VRHLVVNADDFGLSPGVNAGIVHAHEHGIVTSASLMVRQPAAETAAAYARARPALGLGLHVDLGEWAFRDGQWRAFYERVPPHDATAVEAEVHRQLERFRTLLGRDPDHFDSHQHVHRREPAGSVLDALARRLGLPLRGAGQIAFRGDFYGQTDDGESLPNQISIDALLALFDRLPPGATEMACHPGFVDDDDPLGGTVYRSARNAEVAVLCDARVRAGVAARGIALMTYAQAAQALGGAW